MLPLEREITKVIANLLADKFISGKLISWTKNSSSYSLVYLIIREIRQIINNIISDVLADDEDKDETFLSDSGFCWEQIGFYHRSLFKIMTFLTSVLSYYKTRIVSSLKTWISSRECYNQKDEWILRLMNGYVMVRAVHKVQTFTALDSPLIPSSFSCSLIFL